MQLSLEIKTKQQLSLSPQLQQAIRLLQLSTLELHTEIQQVMERNPLLELDEPEGIEIIEHLPHLNAVTTGTSKRPAPQDIDHNDPYHNTQQVESLADHLHSQMFLQNINQRQHLIAIMIIDAINHDGYLPCSVQDIHEILIEQKCDVALGEVEHMLGLIQTFDPPGIAARSVDECIRLQLQRLNRSDSNVQNAITLIENHFEMFSKREYKKICQLSGWDQQTFLDALKIIQGVNPRPGASFAQLVNHYITPDVYVKKMSGAWQVFLNPYNNPTPRVNKKYLAILQETKIKNDAKYIRENLKEAKWLINSITNRNNTLLKVSKAIMDYQIEFLMHGEMAMKPLRLLTIAETVELHESTISRVTTQKFIHTPHGIFELKHFFSSQLQSDDGSACSSTAIKVQIKKLVDEENKDKPLSDNMIAKLLKNDGINIARRTVTKYREALGIVSSTERKSISF